MYEYVALIVAVGRAIAVFLSSIFNFAFDMDVFSLSTFKKMFSGFNISVKLLPELLGGNFCFYALHTS